MIRIDLENHFYAPCLIDALAQRSQPPFYDRATDQIHWTEDVCMPQGELLQRLLEVGEHRLVPTGAAGDYPCGAELFPRRRAA